MTAAGSHTGAAEDEGEYGGGGHIPGRRMVRGIKAEGLHTGAAEDEGEYGGGGTYRAADGERESRLAGYIPGRGW